MSNEKECLKDPILEQAQQKTPTVKTKKEIQAALKKGGEPAVREKINGYIESTNDILDQVNTYGQYPAMAFAVSNQALGIYNKMINSINDGAAGCPAMPATKTEIEEMTLPDFERVLKEMAWCATNPFGCDSKMSIWRPKEVCEERQPSSKNCKMDLAEAVEAIAEGDIFAILDTISESKSIVACTSPYFEKFFNIVPFQFYISKIIAETVGDLMKDVVEKMAPDAVEEMWKEVPCGKELVTKTLKEGTDFEFPAIPEIPRIPYIPHIEIPTKIDILYNILRDAICFSICCALSPLLRISALTMINLGNRWVEQANNSEGFADPHKANPQNLMPELKKTEITSYISDHVLVMAQEENLISSKIEVSFIKAFLRVIYEEESILQRHVIYLLMGDANCQTINKIKEIAMLTGKYAFAQKVGEDVQTLLWNTKGPPSESQILNFFEFLGKNMSVLQAITDSKEGACLPDVCVTRDEITKDTFIDISKAICDMLNPDIGMPAIDLSTLLGPTGASKHVIEGIEAQTDALFTKAKLILYESMGSSGKMFIDDYLSSVKVKPDNGEYSKRKRFIELAAPSISDGAPVYNIDNKRQTTKGGGITRTPAADGTNDSATAITRIFQGDNYWDFNDRGKGGAVSTWADLNTWKTLKKVGPIDNAAQLELSSPKKIGAGWPGLPAAGNFDSVITKYHPGTSQWITYWFKGLNFYTYEYNKKQGSEFDILGSFAKPLVDFMKKNTGRIDAAFITYTDHLNFINKDSLWLGAGNPKKDATAAGGTIHFISGDSIFRYRDPDHSGGGQGPDPSLLKYIPFSGDQKSYPGKIKNYTLFSGIPVIDHDDNPGMKWEEGFDAAFTWKDGITYFFKDRWYFGIDTKEWHHNADKSISPKTMGEKITLRQPAGPKGKIIRNIRDWGSLFGTKRRNPTKRYSKKSEKKIEDNQESIKSMFEKNLKTKDGKPKNLKGDSDDNDPSSITIGNFKELKRDFGINSEYLYGRYDPDTEEHEYGYEEKTGEFYGLKVFFDEQQEKEKQRRKQQAEEEAQNKLSKFKEEI